MSKSNHCKRMNVCVRPGSPAERTHGHATHRIAALAHAGPAAGTLAPGFSPRPDLDLHDRGGTIIPTLTFTNLFVGGNQAWNGNDIAAINSNLALAMQDQRLNAILLQYFRGAAAITSNYVPFTGSIDGNAAKFDQPAVESLVDQMQPSFKSLGFDFSSTVFNFMLPRGVVLEVDDGGQVASSLNGLGGFHGSVLIGGQTVYYAVGVFSEGNNGIVAFDQSWKNVVATFYHELSEARTDAGVANGHEAWLTNENPAEEIGDIPMSLATDVSLVMKEIELADGNGTVPIQLMWSNVLHGPALP